jgi:F5/8 type C domain
MDKLIGFFVFATLASCTVPSFEIAASQSEGATSLDSCNDGVLSAGEADIDCGVVCSAPCASTKTCLDDGDCASGFCSVGVCTEQTCGDLLKNQHESDIDCGGDTGCPRCQPGHACNAQSDCNGGACQEGRCLAPTCTDFLKNQDESDLDCGGICAPCATGKSCVSAADCDRALCSGGKCRAQSCSDGLQNQDESDVDCGGSSGCPRCESSKSCIVETDCDQANCAVGTCQAKSCADGVRNGGETGLDCGGSCSPCADGLGCSVATDCANKVCSTLNACSAPSCSDGVLNGSEPTVDCGSSCGTKCGLADPCKGNGDCASGRCYNSRCAPKSATNTALSATDWIASASATVGAENTLRLGIDGDPGTYWTTGVPQAPGQWFQVDMLKPRAFYSVTVTSDSQATDFGRTLKLSASLDGQTFSVLRSSIVGEKDLKVSFSDPQYARYLRLEELDATYLWWRIDDLRVLQ